MRNRTLLLLAVTVVTGLAFTASSATANDGTHSSHASATTTAAHAHHHLGDHERAADSYQRALDLYRHSGDRHGEAEALIHLGETHHAAGDLDATLITWQHALTILDGMDHPDAESVRTRLEDLAAAARAR